MKLLVVFAICAAAASASVVPPNLTDLDVGELQNIIDAINHPSTDPATAAALEQMLHELLGITQPEAVVPEENEIQPIEVVPEIIDESIISEPANYPQAPLVQVIVKVNSDAAENAVVVEKPVPEAIPEEVSVVEQPDVPEPVQVAPIIIPEAPIEVPAPVIVAPIQPTPAVNVPDILN